MSTVTNSTANNSIINIHNLDPNKEGVKIFEVVRCTASKNGKSFCLTYACEMGKGYDIGAGSMPSNDYYFQFVENSREEGDQLYVDINDLQSHIEQRSYVDADGKSRTYKYIV